MRQTKQIPNKQTPTEFRKTVHRRRELDALKAGKLGKRANVPGANDPELKRAPKDARDARVPGANAQEIR